MHFIKVLLSFSRLLKLCTMYAQYNVRSIHGLESIYGKLIFIIHLYSQNKIKKRYVVDVVGLVGRIPGVVLTHGLLTWTFFLYTSSSNLDLFYSAVSTCEKKRKTFNTQILPEISYRASTVETTSFATLKLDSPPLITAVRRRQLARDPGSSPPPLFSFFLLSHFGLLWKLLNTYFCRATLNFCPMTFAEQLATFANWLLPSN